MRILHYMYTIPICSMCISVLIILLFFIAAVDFCLHYLCGINKLAAANKPNAVQLTLDTAISIEARNYALLLMFVLKKLMLSFFSGHCGYWKSPNLNCAVLGACLSIQTIIVI